MSEPIKHIQEDLEQVAVQFGMNKALAQDLAKAMLARMLKTVGGDYLPKVDKAARNKAIKARFNGVNHEEICHEFGVSKATLYRVLGG